MLDQNFLTKVIELFDLIHKDSATLLLDINSTVLHAGNGNYTFEDFKKQELISYNIFDVGDFPKESMNNKMQSLELVIRSKTTKIFLSIDLRRKNEEMVIYCVQKPIINPSTGNVVAVMIEGRKLNLDLYLYKLLSTKPKKMVDGKVKHTDKLLTLREHEIAFLLIYYKTAKKIARTLSDIYDKTISAKTVSNIISMSLYPKLSVYGIEELIEKLYLLGYHTKIPSIFLADMHLELA